MAVSAVASPASNVKIDESLTLLDTQKNNSGGNLKANRLIDKYYLCLHPMAYSLAGSPRLGSVTLKPPKKFQAIK